jgi:diguanylate cyclase (GGDEF)-like protein/PAS domain S-box-containing protein
MINISYLNTEHTEELAQVEATLNGLATALYGPVEDNFFERVVLRLNQVLQIEYSYIGTVINGQCHTLAIAYGNQIVGSRQYDLAGALCERTLTSNQPIFITTHLNMQLTPNFEITEPIETYIGVPLLSDNPTRPSAVLVLMSHKPLEQWHIDVSFLQAMLVMVGRVVSAELRAAAALKRVREQSEHRFQTLVQNLTDLIVVLAADGSLTYVSPSSHSMLGYESDELLGHNYEEVVHPDDRPISQKGLRYMLRKPGIYSATQFRLGRKDGSWIHCEANGCNMLDDQAVNGLVVVIRDITERKVAEQNLQAQVNFAYHIMNTVGQGLIVADNNGRFEYVNPAYAAMTGYTQEELIGMSAYQMTPPNEIHLVDQARMMRRANRVTTYRKQLLRKDGTLLHIEITGAPRWRDGEIIGSVGVITDLTERYANEQAQIRQQKYQEALHDTALNLMQRQNLDELLESIITRAAALVRSRHGYVALVDPDGEYIRIKIGIGGITPDKYFSSRRGQNLLGKVWETGQPILLNDYRHWEHRRVGDNFDEIGAAISVPLRFGENVVGAIGFVHVREGKYFQAAQLEVLQQFANLAAIALDNTRWYSEAQRRLSELTTVQKVAHIINSKLENAELFETIISQISSAFDLNMMSIYLREGDKLHLKACLGYDMTTAYTEISVNEGICGRVVQSKQPIFVHDATSDPDFLYAEPDIRQCIIVPLMDADENVLGVLATESKEAGRLSHADFDLFLLMGEQVSMAIQNANLVTGLKEAEEAARAAETRYRDILEGSIEGIYQTTPDEEGRFVFANMALARILGYESPDELIVNIGSLRRGFYVLQSRRADFIAALEKSGSVADFESQVFRKDGTIIWVSEVARAVHDAEGKLLYFEGMLQDATDRRRAAEADRKYRAVVDSVHEVIFQTDSGGFWTFLNSAWTNTTGYSIEDSLHRCLLDFVHVQDYRRVAEGLIAVIQRQSNEYRDEVRFINKDGTQCWLQIRISLITDEQGNRIGTSGTLNDITERKTAQEKLHFQAFHDSLTQLPNRTLFLNRLETALERYQRAVTPTSFAVFYLDLDRFKYINDSLGHLVGDEVLKQTARILESCLRPGDLAARLSGDEFTVLLENISSEKMATEVADAILQGLSYPFSLNGQEIFITASIGIAFSSLNYDSPEGVLQAADTALFRAKRQGKARYLVFDTKMYEETMRTLRMEVELRRAVERQEFITYYQPIIRLADGEVAGFEALIRWLHPVRGLVSPLEFVGLAEETGLIVQLGWLMLRESCRDLKKLQQDFPSDPPLSVSVNLSSRQFLQKDLVAQVREALEETGLDPQTLKLEITESIFMEDAEIVGSALRDLRDLGVQIWLDDFGTGFSSLSYLHRFPVDGLKIDRSFVSQMSQVGGNAEIAKTIITLAHSLDMEATAEGVETKDQTARLRALNCKYAQGWWIAQPMPVTMLYTWMNEYAELPFE